MKHRIASLLALSLLAGCLTVLPVSAQTAEPPVVHAVMFWMDGCPHCEDVIQNVLPPLREKHGAQFELLMVEIIDTQDVETLYNIAAIYKIPKDQTRVPFLIIDDVAFAGSDEVRAQLPTLIDDYLARGGVNWPANPILADFLPTALPGSTAPSGRPVVNEAATPSAAMRNNGFTLAIVIMAGMAIVLLYTIISFATGKTYHLPDWADWLVPALIVIGIGVAGYLSYVETQYVAALCGPVGDCNTVQQSRYAKLFGILPIGVLGLFGYLALLAAWLGRKFIRQLETAAAISFWGMAFFAVIFSLYLTYLEPFVVKAVCIWCLTSAVIVTLLLLLGTPPIVRQFTLADEDE